ncbi:Methylmalonate-semialdehyde dehydrogenase acylating, mitochondrial [Porphyridium purpureum]|uniref:methylmalonate-semialdehyde dehydrogenase (CoA acylating) n=1 Tax=Porphyridium purpureum TaxID=35688 RepID=A0A5J4YS37_PORPP|nr:Methylmalonate-semialdehyde dehydrogenase acylating, mitochondrial [Porphyridium purpureum]|eukprot:POR5492..scf229_5
MRLPAMRCAGQVRGRSGWWLRFSGCSRQMSVAARGVPHLIGGEWVHATPARPGQQPHHNELHSSLFSQRMSPINGELVALVPKEAGSDTVHRAVEAADAAFSHWSRLAASKRAQYLFALRDKVAANVDHIAASISRELGKTPADARGDVVRGLEVLEFATACVPLLSGRALPNFASGIDVMQHREPLGVCLAVAPFNFPAMIPLWVFPLAIACGNTVILKPSELVPGASTILGELCESIQLPAGVLNIVQGGRETVQALIKHPRVQSLSFVGSTPAGTELYRTATQHGKRAQCNLGAKNHAVLMPDCDSELALNSLVGAAFGACGQRCMAVSVAVLVGEARALLDPLCDRVRALKIGTGDQADFGPLVTQAAKSRIEQVLASVEPQGGRLLVDGRKNEQLVQLPSAGNWLGPSIAAEVRPGMRVYDEEVFGPVLSVLCVDTLDEALQLINANAYGNGASIFTASGAHASHFQAQVKAGQVGINVPIPLGPPAVSFTGSRGSFLGDLPFYGASGVEFFTRPKNIISRWPVPSEAPAQSHANMMNIPTATS